MGRFPSETFLPLSGYNSTGYSENEPGNKRGKYRIFPLTYSINRGMDHMGDQIEAYYFTHNGGIRTNNEDSLLIGQIL
ncbi:MAG: hypothetical protein CVV33_09900, partial [Methanomicrobiales archaeon HGW-Methanomicrobiales-4]